jgi:hypothetical protein
LGLLVWRPSRPAGSLRDSRRRRGERLGTLGQLKHNNRGDYASRHPKSGTPAWSLLVLAGFWLLCSATGAAAQGPPRVQKVAAVETYQGTPVGFTADGHPFRGKRMPR